jgi:cardiolipin synthase
MPARTSAPWLALGFLTAAGGCHMPAAHPAGCGGDALPRQAVLARQLAADTAAEATCHPLRCGWSVLTEPGDYLRATAQGIFDKRLGLRLSPDPVPVDPDRPRLDPDELEEEMCKVSGNDLEPGDLRLYVDGGAALAALGHVIDEAACRIDVLMYLWDNDPLGWEVAHRLAAWAGPGRRLRVMVDGGGNLMSGLPPEAPTAEVNRVVCWLAGQPHVELLRTRNPCARFDHRKLVVADGRLAWSGGRNFTRPSFFEDHDLSYTLEGPLAARMAEVFETFWRDQGGEPADPPLPPPAPPTNTAARLVRTRPLERQFAQVLYHAVDRACHHVYVENPYFTDSRLLARLARARRRGADVRVVLTLQSGSAVIDGANRVTANRLLAAGVRVYLYPGMTHVKATAVDGRWAYLGTGNFDALSLRHNRELGLAVGGGPVLDVLEEVLFRPDMRPEWELGEPLPLSAADYTCEVLASLFL